MKKAITLIVFFLFSCNSSNIDCNTYYLIRHAEKVRLNPDNKDPELNEAGKVLGALAEITHSTNGTLSQLILISDSKFIADDGGGAAPENHIFVMNAVDYLLGDKELISLRSREITNRPLQELEDDVKARWKWINILFPSLIVMAFGGLRMRREKNRAKFLEEIYG